MLLVRTCLSLCLLLSSSGVLPAVAGHNLLEAPVTWTWSSDKQTIAVFAFSRAAGTDAAAWRRRLDQETEFEHGARVVTIIMLEAVPHLWRGVAQSAIKSSIPARQGKSTILTYHDEDRWKSLLKVSDDRYAYVLLVAPNGQPLAIAANGFSEKQYKYIESEILTQSR